MKEVLIELGIVSEETKCACPGECGETLAGPFISGHGYWPDGRLCD